MKTLYEYLTKEEIQKLNLHQQKYNLLGKELIWKLKTNTSIFDLELYIVKNLLNVLDEQVFFTEAVQNNRVSIGAPFSSALLILLEKFTGNED